MLAVARPKPHSRRKEPTCGAPVARFRLGLVPSSEAFISTLYPAVLLRCNTPHSLLPTSYVTPLHCHRLFCRMTAMT